MIYCKGLFFIFLISETLFLCVYLFSTGFLLRKNVIEVSSTCNDFQNASNSCWLPKRYDKLILIMIDALRFDFAYYNESIKLEDQQYFENNMKIFHELQQQYPLNGRLSKFIADAPTTTSQRLKGLTTGSLPTFIDVGSNFGCEDIGNEDNIIDQLRKHKRRIVGLGDDTWSKLFPGRFHRSHFFPSFDINDLHTVDDGILEHLASEVLKLDWDVLIAHFLGVDHCGHLFGTTTKQIKDKLLQMDNVVRNVAELMDENTVLIVAGDHGMTSNGDHGGEEEDEVTSALFFYSKKPLFSQFGRSSTDHHTVEQIDIVPTLALLLGVPIPYSNIGLVIEDMFQDRLTPLILNAKQVYRYLFNYQSKNPDFLHWNYIHNEYQSLMVNPTLDEALNFLNLAKAVCRNVWSQFNVTVMYISICIGVIFFIVYSLYLVEMKFWSANLLKLFLVTNFLSLMYFFGYTTALWIFLAYLCYFCVDYQLVFDLRSTFPIVLFIIAGLPTFSNSFVVEEHLVTNFLIASIASIKAYHCVIIYRKHSLVKPFGRNIHQLSSFCYVVLLVSSRLGSVSFRCREHQKWCRYEIPFFHKSLESLPFITACARVCIAITVISCSLLVLMRLWRKLKLNFVLFLTVCNSCSVSVYWLAKLYGREINILPLFSYCSTIFIYIYYITKSFFNRLNLYLFYAFSKKNYLSYTDMCISLQKRHKYNSFIIQIFNSYVILIFNIFISIVVILSSGYVISALLIVVAAVCVLVIHSSHVWLQSNKRNLFNVQLLPLLLWFFLSQEGFYITGHQMTFTTIHWLAAFVGFKQPNNMVAGILVGIDTFSSQILFGMTCPLLCLAPFVIEKYFNGAKEAEDIYSIENENRIVTCLTQYCASYILVHSIKVLLTSAAALLLRRHLMLWAIFAPHFIFEAIGFGVTCSSVILGYIFVASFRQFSANELNRSSRLTLSSTQHY